MESRYVGSELEVFAGARNWKAYWSGIIRAYVGSHILDVGAGIGSTAKAFVRLDCARYLALEPDVALAQRMTMDASHEPFPPNFEVSSGTIDDLPSDPVFDTILYIDVLEHIADDADELGRAASRLVPGGRLVVLSPAHQFLFSEFDAAIGHVRRYNRESLLAVKPDRLTVDSLFYLDSVGLLASLGNRVFLRSDSPTAGQIALWDDWMVPASRIFDRITRFSIGKSIVGVFRKPWQ